MRGLLKKESTPRYYFSDNGLINLFLNDKRSALLENQVAVALMRAYPDGVCYLKSARTGIDIDFYVPEARHIIQAAWSIEGNAFERETGSIMKFAESSRLPGILIQ